MENPETLLVDWQFWTALFAFLAIVLSQLPPVRMWFRPNKLEVEVHSRITVTHKVGNPNVTLYVSIANTGGRTPRISGISVDVKRDGKFVTDLPAQSYFETPASQSSILFVPFTLKPGESWGHATNFYSEWDRTTEKLFRESESNLRARIKEKIEARAENDKNPVIVEDAFLEPFQSLFRSKFIWQPGEYIIELHVQTTQGAGSFKKCYRFTLFESDSKELISHTDDYKYGGGLSYNVDKHVGIFVPLTEHTD